METKTYKITQWVKSYETISKIQFFTGCWFYRIVRVDFVENEKTACNG